MFGMDDNEMQVEVSGDASGAKSALDSAITKMGGLKAASAAAATAVGGLSVALAGKSVKAAADFDAAMQESIAIMGNVSDSMREDLEATAREVATSTTHSHEQAAESFYFLASAGLDATQAMEAMPEVAAFAEAGQMDMAQATDVATNVMSAYGIEAKNMTSVTDVMTQTIRNHNQTMEGLSAAFKNAAPAAASMGVEIEELAALTGALGDVGIQAQEAGTALNAIMRRMAKRSGEAGKALDKLGIETTDAQGNLLPLVEIIEQLEEANMNSAQASAIFGRQLSAGNALVNTGADELREYQSAISDAEGATREVAETQRDTFNKELAVTKSELNDIAISIGNQLLPAVTAMLRAVNDGIESFGELNKETDGFLGVALLTAGTLTGVAGAISLVGGSAAAAIPSVAGLGAAVTLLTGPVGVAIVAASLMAGAWAANLGDIRGKTEKTVDFISEKWHEMNTLFSDDMGADEFGEVPEGMHRPGEDPEQEEEQGREDAGSYGKGYMSKLNELKNQDTALDNIQPPETEVEAAGVSTGKAYMRGVDSGMSDRDKAGRVSELRREFKNADSLKEKKRIQDKIQDIRNPKGMNIPDRGMPGGAQGVHALGPSGSGGPSVSAGGGGVGGVRTPKASKLGRSVGKFASAVDTFAQAIRDMEVVVTVRDSEFARVIDARYEDNTQKTARRGELRGIK